VFTPAKKETSMNKPSLIALASVGAVSGILAVKAQQSEIEVKGLTRKIIAEQVLSGPLTELNGKYKMVAVEFSIAPGGYVGPHLHAGPGYRCVIHGVVTNVEADGKSTDYHSGECYFEGGDKSHTPRNNGDTMVLGVQVELLPATWTGSSLLPVPASK
jgi:quercetin dioxygenase-like cupin family protein